MAVKHLPVAILAGSALAGGGGAIAGAMGGVQIGRAQLQMRHNAGRYERRYDSHSEQVARANEALRALGQEQENAQREVIFRMRDFLERHEKQVRAHAHLIVAGVDGSTSRIVEAARLDRDVAGWIGGVTGSVAVGAATPAALRKAVTSRMKASTGTAISSLHGAAKESATRAALGGGSLEAGGGGMSLGGTVLRAAPVGTGVLIAGLAVKNRGAKARTEAEAYRTEVDIAIAQLDIRDQLLRGVQDRARELEEILTTLSARATNALDLLESEPFDIEAHADRLQAALILVVSVREVATAPIADDEGNLDEGTEPLILKYRDAPTEDANV
jgi:hypothetical protein